MDGEATHMHWSPPSLPRKMVQMERPQMRPASLELGASRASITAVIQRTTLPCLRNVCLESLVDVELAAGRTHGEPWRTRSFQGRDLGHPGFWVACGSRIQCEGPVRAIARTQVSAATSTLLMPLDLRSVAKLAPDAGLQSLQPGIPHGRH